MSHQVSTERNEEIDPRRCEHVREDGSHCKGWKVKGRAYCAGHSGIGIAADPKSFARTASAESARARSERAEVRREAAEGGLRAVLGRKLEQHANELADRLMDIVREGSDADALRAIEAMSNRVLGRPTEHVEVADVRLPKSVEDIRAMSPEERRAALRELNARLRTGTDD